MRERKEEGPIATQAAPTEMMSLAPRRLYSGPATKELSANMPIIGISPRPASTGV